MTNEYQPEANTSSDGGRLTASLALSNEYLNTMAGTMGGGSRGADATRSTGASDVTLPSDNDVTRPSTANGTASAERPYTGPETSQGASDYTTDQERFGGKETSKSDGLKRIDKGEPPSKDQNSNSEDLEDKVFPGPKDDPDTIGTCPPDSGGGSSGPFNPNDKEVESEKMDTDGNLLKHYDRKNLHNGETNSASPNSVESTAPGHQSSTQTPGDPNEEPICDKPGSHGEASGGSYGKPPILGHPDGPVPGKPDFNGTIKPQFDFNSRDGRRVDENGKVVPNDGRYADPHGTVAVPDGGRRGPTNPADGVVKPVDKSRNPVDKPAYRDRDPQAVHENNRRSNDLEFNTQNFWDGIAGGTAPVPDATQRRPRVNQQQQRRSF